MLCNFLCSDVSWRKAASSSGDSQLSKHQSLCLNFIVNPSTRVHLAGAAVCRMTSCVCMEQPSFFVAPYFFFGDFCRLFLLPWRICCSHRKQKDLWHWCCLSLLQACMHVHLSQCSCEPNLPVGLTGHGT